MPATAIDWVPNPMQSIAGIDPKCAISMMSL